jgi:hypothetical protein
LQANARPIHSESRKPAINDNGSLTTLTSRMIFPAASTTQTLENSKDTSIPAYCSMVVPDDAWREGELDADA